MDSANLINWAYQWFVVYADYVSLLDHPVFSDESIYRTTNRYIAISMSSPD